MRLRTPSGELTRFTQRPGLRQRLLTTATTSDSSTTLSLSNSSWTSLSTLKRRLPAGGRGVFNIMTPATLMMSFSGISTTPGTKTGADAWSFPPYLGSPSCLTPFTGLALFPLALCILVRVDSCMYTWFSLAVSDSGLDFLRHLDFLVLEHTRFEVGSILYAH